MFGFDSLVLMRLSQIILNLPHELLSSLQL